MCEIKSFRDLRVWQMSITLTGEVYRLLKKLPKEELYALSDQMKRGAVSISSNISEGKAQNTRNGYAHFLTIARGSVAELESQLLTCVEIGYLTETDIYQSMDYLAQIGRMLNTMISSLRKPAK